MTKAPQNSQVLAASGDTVVGCSLWRHVAHPRRIAVYLYLRPHSSGGSCTLQSVKQAWEISTKLHRYKLEEEFPSPQPLHNSDGYIQLFMRKV